MPISRFQPIRLFDPDCWYKFTYLRQTVQIQIKWLLQKPTDLDLHCLHRQDISGFSRTRINHISTTYWTRHVFVKHYAPNYMLVDTNAKVGKVHNFDKINLIFFFFKVNQVIYLSSPISLFVCVEVLRPSQPNGVMSSAVILPNHSFTGQA